jgi:hypothetical protein
MFELSQICGDGNRGIAELDCDCKAKMAFYMADSRI